MQILQKRGSDWSGLSICIILLIGSNLLKQEFLTTRNFISITSKNTPKSGSNFELFLICKILIEKQQFGFRFHAQAFL